MENSTIKSGDGSAEERKILNSEEPELKEKKEEVKSAPKVSRWNDFAHTHPSHARHKSFGLDHEPGAF